MQTKESKKVEAKARQEAYDKLSTQEKIQQLDNQFGVGIGAKKQRYKLMCQELAGKGKKA